MKILSIMAGFFPGKKYGGPPVSMDNFCTLMNEMDCYIVCRDHDMRENERYKNIHDGWNERSNCKVCYLSDGEYNEKVFERIIQELQPDVIYLQGLFQACVVPCLKLAKKYGIRVLLAPRGELCAGAFRKKYKKLPYIAALKLLGLVNNIDFQSTSEEETAAIQRWLKVREDRIHLLANIPSIPKEEYPHPFKESGKAKFIFISRIIWKKNLLFALKCLKNVEGNVQFDIYGPIEDQKYWEKCQQEIAVLPDNIKVNYCGLIGHEEVHRTFSQYDAFLLPTLSENFGHVIAEALSVGCPVIISDQTPFTDVNIYHAGRAIPLDDSHGFSEAIQAIINQDNRGGIDMACNTKIYFDKKFNISSLKEIYRKVLTK